MTGGQTRRVQKGAASGPWISGKSDQHNVWKSLKELFVKQLHSDAAPNENLSKRTECQFFPPPFLLQTLLWVMNRLHLLCEEDMLISECCKHWEMEVWKCLCFGEFYIYFAQNARKLTELPDKKNLEYEIDNLTHIFFTILGQTFKPSTIFAGSNSNFWRLLNLKSNWISSLSVSFRRLWIRSLI